MTARSNRLAEQSLDEEMIVRSASNRLPPVMFSLQLNLSGVIILFGLMFYANALGLEWMLSSMHSVCV